MRYLPEVGEPTKRNSNLDHAGILAHCTKEIVMTKDPGLDGRHRDKNGEISKKHGNTLISTLRQTYGAGFAPGRSGNEKLKDVLHELDEPSLTHLIHEIRKSPT
jgi:hypothetical protein